MLLSGDLPAGTKVKLYVGDKFENGNIDAIIDFEALAQSRWNSIMSVGSYDYYIAVSDERQDLYEQLHKISFFLLY